MKTEYKLPSRVYLDSLNESEIIDSLELLENHLTNRLKNSKDNWDKYWKEVNKIIEELKSLDHDLWSHDYDGERKHLWGWDYMKPETCGKLQIEFDFKENVTTYWKTINPQIGTTNEDA